MDWNIVKVIESKLKENAISLKKFDMDTITRFNIKYYIDKSEYIEVCYVDGEVIRYSK